MATLSKPRLCFLGYPSIREQLMPVVVALAPRADIEVIDAPVGAALEVARDRLRQGSVDAFVSAGANADLLRNGLNAPVASIRISGFDLFQALQKARRVSPRIGIVTYDRVLPELDTFRELLNIELAQYTYRTPLDAREKIETLSRQGFEIIVGSSLAVGIAESMGLKAVLAYSSAGILEGFENGLELARMARLEASRYEQLNGVLHNLQEAVLAVDLDHRVIALNPPMQRLLSSGLAPVLGRRLDEIEPDLSLRSTLDSGVEERGQAHRFSQRDWIVNRTPIREHGDLVGAAITLYDARQIQEADVTLRIQQRRQQTGARYTFDTLIGRSAAFRKAVGGARRFANTDLTVLITGESGVGKELFAQAMHNASARAGKPFVAINCASFPESLLESELFGHEEGAFTGARRGGRRGLFEAAHTGTLFLDEIGDMPASLQTRLLRVLQEREVTRLGATAPIPVDVRIIAATHQPLTQLIADKRFRQDLFYRISTLRLAVPPLRDRRDDIAELARLRLGDAMRAVGLGWNVERAIAPLLPFLLAHLWPGNVRELENVVQRLAVFFVQFANPEDIPLDELRSECPELFEQAAGLRKEPEALRERVIEVMKECKGNRRKAAEKLGVSRTTLWRLIQQFGAE